MKRIFYFSSFALLLCFFSCDEELSTDLDNGSQVDIRTVTCVADVWCCVDAPTSNPPVFSCPLNTSSCVTSPVLGKLAFQTHGKFIGQKCWVGLTGHQVDCIRRLNTNNSPCNYIQFAPQLTGSVFPSYIFTWNSSNISEVCDQDIEYQAPSINPNFTYPNYDRFDWQDGVDCDDADIIDLYLAGNINLLSSVAEKIAADVNVDGQITKADSKMIRDLAFCEGNPILNSFPTSNLSGIQGLANMPWAYLDANAYDYASANITFNSNIENLTRLAYINEKAATRRLILATNNNCQDLNIYGAYDFYPYNSGQGMETFAIKRGDVNFSFCP